MSEKKTTIRVGPVLRDRVKDLRNRKPDGDLESQEEVVERLVQDEEKKAASDRHFATG